MNDATTVRGLLTWFLDTEQENDLRRGLEEIPAAVWPAFSAEAAAELREREHRQLDLKRHLLGDERRRREYHTEA